MNLSQGYYSTTQAAEMLDFTSAHVRRLILGHKLLAEKVGNGWLISYKEINRFLNARRKKQKKDESHYGHSDAIE